jgi:hypothetical protein
MEFIEAAHAVENQPLPRGIDAGALIERAFPA